MYLTLRRKKFIEAYTGKCFGNGTKSAIEAGYSTKTARSIASELLKIPYISGQIKARIKANTLSAEDIVRRLTELIEECTNARDKARVYELLGKAKGIFKDSNAPQVALFAGISPQATVNNRVNSDIRGNSA